jgi:lipoprotein-anchoring transpeptidase ErfK/SrfK
MQNRTPLSRRNFLKLAGLGLAGASLRSWDWPLAHPATLPEYPDAERLARVVWWGTELKTRPAMDAPAVRTLVEDEIFPWLHETVGSHPTEINQKWVETPEGFIWSPHVQPVRSRPNTPVETLPQTSLGPGMWAEVTVPYVDLILDNPPPRSPWLEDRITYGLAPRLYYTQVLWIDGVKTDESGQRLYRVNERWGYGDIFWAAAEAFRPITAEEVSPINPNVEDKRIVVSVPYQTLSCYEGSTEVYFCRVSTGALYNAQGQRVDAWATPAGEHRVWRKLYSLHMSGGTTGGGWDLPGVGWTALFVGSGVAVHSTFFHNNFGVPMSRGCVNAAPEDAKWIFRWTTPVAAYDPGDITVELPGGTAIQVVEG